MKVGDVTFLEAQHKDGSWDELLFPLNDDMSGIVLSNYELTAEFTFELCEIIKSLTGDVHER